MLLITNGQASQLSNGHNNGGITRCRCWHHGGCFFVFFSEMPMPEDETHSGTVRLVNGRTKPLQDILPSPHACNHTPIFQGTELGCFFTSGRALHTTDWYTATRDCITTSRIVGKPLRWYSSVHGRPATYISVIWQPQHFITYKLVLMKELKHFWLSHYPGTA